MTEPNKTPPATSKKKNEKLAKRELAKREIQRIAKMVDANISRKDWEDPGIDRLIRAIEDGRLTVDEKGQPTVHLPEPIQDTESITFFRPKGKVMLALDEAKKDKNVDATFKALAAMSGEDPDIFEALDLAETKLCSALGGLFFV